MWQKWKRKAWENKLQPQDLSSHSDWLLCDFVGVAWLPLALLLLAHVFLSPSLFYFFLLFNLILPSKWLLFFKLSISILFKWTGLIINVNTYNCLLFSLNNSYYFKSAYFMFFSFSFSIYYVVLFFLAFKIIFSKLNELVLFTLWFLYNLIS